MKKRILIAVACVLLAALILQLPIPREQVSQPTEPTVPTTTQPTTTLPQREPGVVRLYSCDKERLPELVVLAEEYYALTGTEVILLSAQEEGCRATLENLMASQVPPTVLCLHSQEDLENWADDLLDLQPTPLSQALMAEAFGFRMDGKLLALPMELEAKGLMFNAQLMAVSLTRKDITDFTTLSTAVQILKNNGLKAFATAHWENALHLLQNSQPDSVRAFLDLYAGYSLADGDGMTQFLQGKAVFYFGGSDLYDQMEQQADRKVEMRNLDMLPLWTAEGMHYTCATAWAVNGSAREEDVAATLAFLTWLVTAEEGKAAPVDRLQTLTPFVQAAWYGTQLEKKIRGYMSQEPAVLLWAAPEAETTVLIHALRGYLSDPTEETWAVAMGLLWKNRPM